MTIMPPFGAAFDPSRKQKTMMSVSTIWRPAACLATAIVLLTSVVLAPAAADEADPAVSALERAQRSGQAVEVQQWTDEYSLTHANPDGSFTLETSREPQRIERNDQWIPIDTTVALDPDGQLRPRATLVEMTFTSGGDTELATASHQGRSLTLHAPFPLTEPVIDDNTITYPDVLPDVDLVVTVHPDAFSEVLVVHTPRAAQHPDLQQLDFAIETDALELQISADGSSQALDPHGEPVFYSEAPIMWDSTPGPGGEIPSATASGENSAPIEVLTDEAFGLQTTHLTPVVLIPDPDLLSAPDTTFPIYIDPSISAARRNFVVTREGASSYANNTDVLRVGYCNWAECNTPYRARSYVDFNISALQKRNGQIATVYGANLQLTQLHAASGAATPVMLARTTGPISTSTQWPGPFGSALETKSTTSGQTSLFFDGSDLTAYLNSAVYHQYETIGFNLRAPNESDRYQWKKFANNPVLTIRYGYPTSIPDALSINNATTCNAITYAPSTTPTLRARAYNNNHQDTGVHIIFYIWKADGTYVGNHAVNDASGVIQSWTTGTLPAGAYFFKAAAQARVSDGTWVTSPLSDAVNFTTSPPLNAPLTPTIWSTTHAHFATYTDTNNGTFNLATGSNDIVGYFYSWGSSTVPARSNETCATATKTITNNPGQVTGYVKAQPTGQATLTIPANMRLDGNGQPLTTTAQTSLYVKPMNRAGQVSTSAGTYTFQLTPNNHTVTTLQAENQLNTTATTSSHTITTGTQLAGGRQLTINAAANTHATFNLTVPTEGTWLIQPDLNVPMGRQLTFQVNGQDLGIGKFDPATLTHTCDKATHTGTGSTTATALHPATCNGTLEDPDYITLTPHTTNTLTITTPTATTYHIDQIRLIKLPNS